MTTHQPETTFKSEYKRILGVPHKSCPACSARKGQPVFYPTEDFGVRQVAPGEFMVQSWCAACRSKKEAADV